MKDDPESDLFNRPTITSSDAFYDKYPDYPMLKLLGKVIEIRKQGPYDMPDDPSGVVYLRDPELHGLIEVDNIASFGSGNNIISFYLTASDVEIDHLHSELNQIMEMGEAVLIHTQCFTLSDGEITVYGPEITRTGCRFDEII